MLKVFISKLIFVSLTNYMLERPPFSDILSHIIIINALMCEQHLNAGQGGDLIPVITVNTVG